MRKRIFSWAAAKAFRRLLVKYMIIVLVPVLVLVSATALLLRGNFLSAQARKVQDALDSAQSSVNYTLEAVDSIIVGMDKSRLNIPSILQIDAYSRVNVSNLLNNYALLDAFYASLYAYIPQTPDFLYSPSGTMPLSVLAEFGFADDATAFARQIEQMEGCALRANLTATEEAPEPVAQFQRNHAYLYICPARGLSSTPAVAVFLRIPESVFLSAYQALWAELERNDYALCVLDEAGNVIGVSGGLLDGEEVVSASRLQVLAQSLGAECFRAEHDNFQICFFLRAAVLHSAIGPQMKTVYAVMGAILLVAALASVILARQVYRPIALLHQNVIAGIRDMPIDNTELKSIDKAIEDIMLSHRKQEEQSRHILDITKRQLVYWALLNGLPRTRHMEQLLNMAGFTQPNMLFCVLAIQLPASTPQSLVDELCQSIQEADWSNSSVTAVWIPSHDVLSVVFHMFVELDSRARQEYAANMLRMILEQYGIASGIGVGLSQPTLYTLSRSYSTARRALNGDSVPYRLFEDLQDEGADRFSLCLSRLCAHFNEADVTGARADVAQYLQMLDEIAANRSLLAFYTTRLLSDLSRFLVDMGVWLPAQMDSEIERLIFLDTKALAMELETLLAQAGANPAPSPHTPSTNEPNGMLQSVHEYLVENALDPMLNVNLVAEKFGLSVVTLNRRFRQRYGSTMVSIVSEIRMQKAMELLRDSDMRIKDIVTAVGYFDVPNFSRKFKAALGMTPGQYRRRERGGLDDQEEADEE